MSKRKNTVLFSILFIFVYLGKNSNLKGIDISGFPSHESVAFNMGKDSVDQKGKFIGMDQGPASMGEVVHLYNFENIRNRTKTPLLM